jgi:hypothetical protein
MKQAVTTIVLVAVVLGGCAAPTEVEETVATTASALAKEPLHVDFADCSELASITPLPVAQARTVVPADLALAGDGTVAPFVVRVARCAAVSIDGVATGPGTVAQLGVSIVSPDGTGDINNYVAWYYTTSHTLAQRLRALGIPAEWVPDLTYQLAGGTLHIEVDHPGHPTFAITAQVVEPGPAAVPFTANWWTETGPFLTKMSTPIPVIRFGGASTTLTTPANGALGRLLGTPVLSSFPYLDSFNRFPAAPMTVSVLRR